MLHILLYLLVFLILFIQITMKALDIHGPAYLCTQYRYISYAKQLHNVQIYRQVYWRRQFLCN